MSQRLRWKKHFKELRRDVRGAIVTVLVGSLIAVLLCLANLAWPAQAIYVAILLGFKDRIPVAPPKVGASHDVRTRPEVTIRVRRTQALSVRKLVDDVFCADRSDGDKPLDFEVTPKELIPVLKVIVERSTSGYIPVDPPSMVPENGSIHVKFRSPLPTGAYTLMFSAQNGHSIDRREVTVLVDQQYSQSELKDFTEPGQKSDPNRVGDLQLLKVAEPLDIPPAAFKDLNHWCVYAYLKISSNTILRESLPEGITVTINLADGRLVAQKDGRDLALSAGNTEISLRQLAGNDPISFFVTRADDGILSGLMINGSPWPIARFRITRPPPPDPPVKDFKERLTLLSGDCKMGGVGVSVFAESMGEHPNWLIPPKTATRKARRNHSSRTRFSHR